MFTRRRFVLSSLAVAAVPSLLPRFAHARLRAPRRQFADVPLRSVKLRDDCWLIAERGGNSMLLNTKEGPALIDTKITGSGRLLARETRRVVGEAPSMVINTHHHFDHTGGNFAFDDTAEIVAHKNLNPRMQANLDQMFKPSLAAEINALRNAGKEQEAAEMAQWADALTVDDFKADRTYDDTLAITRGETKFALHHFGNGHTDNDTIVHLPDLDVVHMGDLFFNRMYPFIDRDAGANTVGWRAVIRKALEMCGEKTIVIPGHGEVTDRAGLAKQIEFFDQLQAIVEKAMREGSGKATIGALQPAEFEGFGLDMLREQALTAMYDELAIGMN